MRLRSSRANGERPLVSRLLAEIPALRDGEETFEKQQEAIGAIYELCASDASDCNPNAVL